jgi:hypothetical protein
MNTLKTVYDKLFKEETTNLASHEVELANINDLVQEMNKSEKLLSDFNSLYEQVDKIAPSIIKVGNDFIASKDRINELARTFDKQFADLGLKFSEYKEAKKLMDINLKSREVPTMVARIKNL